MKPFLLISIRGEQAAAENEYASFRRLTGLPESALPLVNLARAELPSIDLDDWSGILMGGGPWNTSDTPRSKGHEQRRAELAMVGLLDQVVQRDFPFLGVCYGIGVLGQHQGGAVDRSRPEEVGPLSVSLTTQGQQDPVLEGVPSEFVAYGGHKESLARLPRRAVTLATSRTCPVQAFRVRRNIYATQFHPELDSEGISTRIEVYKDAGYFDPGQAETIKERSRSVHVEHPMRLLRNFVQLHQR